MLPRFFLRHRDGCICNAYHYPKGAIYPAASPAISVRGLSVWYDESKPPILESILFDVNVGDLVLLVGPDRAGKTTLLRALAGIIDRIEGSIAGSIQLAGIDEKLLPTMQQMADLAVYFGQDQFASVLGLTVDQEMLFWTKGDESAARSHLAAMGIQHLWGKESTKLSGGEEVRLVLACALAANAPVLLMDNPTDQLDPEGRAAFVEALRVMKQQRRKTILITDRHFNEFIEDVSGLLALNKGHLKAALDRGQLLDSNWVSEVGLPSSPPTIPGRARSRGNRVGALRDVHVTFDGVEAVKGVDIEFFQGECVMVRGPNGSGKTSAMLALTGGIAPDRRRGRVERPARVGYVFQDAALQLVATEAGEEIAIGPRLQGDPADEIQKVVDDGLAWAELAFNDSPFRLHEHDAKMLAIAAMSPRIDLLVLDEPTVGVDCHGVQKIIRHITTLLDGNASVVVISHDEEMYRIADRIVQFESGRVILDTPVIRGK
jgi:energy-coupling factor transport system ATP-binding protein